VKAPAFWWLAQPSLLARLLSPFGRLYGAITARRMAKPGVIPPVPVICVGNLVAGGAGKTPTVQLLTRQLYDIGRDAFVLTRGYGGRLAGPTRVDVRLHTARDVGDEPLMLARTIPTIVSVDRPAGAALAAGLGADVIVMDDGLQNPSLVKALRLAVVDGIVGIGNGLCVPAGPLRAPMDVQWPYVDVLVVIGPGAAGQDLARQARQRCIPVVTGQFVPDPVSAIALRARKVIAFAGIGRPSKFFEMLSGIGVTVVQACSFADHHPYSKREILSLAALANEHDSLLVTTAKDAVRLPSDLPADVMAHLRVLDVSLALDDADMLSDLLRARLSLEPPRS
jgi:tetraacyldisaccharide 4'-kinase